MKILDVTLIVTFDLLEKNYNTFGDGTIAQVNYTRPNRASYYKVMLRKCPKSYCNTPSFHVCVNVRMHKNFNIGHNF